MTKEQFDFISEISALVRLSFPCVPFDVCDYIASQSALETNYGKSNICVDNCNLFGMKNPSIRITTSIGENRGHALYICRIDSIVDYFLWLQMAKFTQPHFCDLERFKSRLSSSSYNPQHSDYVKKIDSIFLTYKSLCDDDLPF